MIVRALVAALCLVLTPAGAAYADSATASASAPATSSPSASASASASGEPLISPENDDAMLNILMENGVQYTTSTEPDDAATYSGDDTTLVIDGDETNLSASGISQLADTTWGRVVILSDDPNVLDAFAPGVRASTQVSGPADASTPVSPQCDQADANTAGPVLMPTGSEVYRLPSTASTSSTATAGASPDAGSTGSPAPRIEDVTACYPAGSGDSAAGDSAAPAMVSVLNESTGGDVIMLGWTDFVENQYLAQQGDAALALRLFGAHGTLVWLATQFTEDENLTGCQGISCGDGGNASGRPTSTAGQNGSGEGSGSGGGGGSGGSGGGNAQAVTLAQLIPHWIWWMLLQLVLAALALAYWRSRRLGRLVHEKLPVRVRAAETVEGHANLYRRASAHGRAAGLLRSAAARRIAPLLGLAAGPAGRSPASLSGPVAERLGLPLEQVHAILAGPEPKTEAELVRLTDQLDRLEQEVRSP